jgi:uncharacterized DUF497 family protein
MRHPSTATDFEWDEGNEEKLAARGILPQDVEHVWANRPQYRRNKRRGTAPWMTTGRDGGGRTLKVGILWADEGQGFLRAITGLVVPR